MDFDGSIEVPGDEELQAWTLKLPAKAGVYLLWGEANEPILLATTGGLRAAVRRKLQTDTDQTSQKRTQLDKITKGVSWKQANSQFAAYAQFHELARQIYPGKYRQMLGWKDSWWVKMCLSEKPGRILPSKKIDVPGLDEYIGPWPSSKAVKNFIDLATDMYGLCRNHDVLKQMNRNKSCTYAQIGSCCGVCEGKTSVEEYRRMLEQAGELAEPEKRLKKQRQLQEQMNEAAAKLDFEAAENNKKLIKRLKGLENKESLWAGNLRRFAFLVVSPGADRKHIQPWRVNAGEIESGEEVKLAEIESQISNIVAWARQGQTHWPENKSEVQFRREKISMVSYFLFRRHSDQCLYYRLDRLPEQKKLIEQIKSKFAKEKTTPLKSSPMGQ